MAGRRAKIATLSAVLFLVVAPLVAGCAEEADQGSEPFAATSPPKPDEPERPLEQEAITGRERQLQTWRDWWHHAREVLMTDIQPSAEQAQAIDAVIARELDKGAELEQREAELRAARKARDSARVDAARTALGETRAQLKKTHEIYEELRALLSEAQRPQFDMNRAHLVAESQAEAQESEAPIDPSDRAKRQIR